LSLNSSMNEFFNLIVICASAARLASNAVKHSVSLRSLFIIPPFAFNTNTARWWSIPGSTSLACVFGDGPECDLLDTLVHRASRRLFQIGPRGSAADSATRGRCVLRKVCFVTKSEQAQKEKDHP
jgi:hypothetical protein